MQYVSIKREEWEKNLEQLLLSHAIFAPFKNGSGLDYELVKTSDIALIVYNSPKPVTPLKFFFLPFREDVTTDPGPERPRIIIGAPNCDIEALSLIDEIYLDNEFTDLWYRKKRDETILISTDCFTINENCHCLTYGINPYSEKKGDLALASHDGTVYLRVITSKGEELVRKMMGVTSVSDDEIASFIERKHHSVERQMLDLNKDLPDYDLTGMIVHKAPEQVWLKYSSKCVSCGACAAICPTCTCFLLIDKPGFVKIKHTDACQYPGFERVAGGEDPLFEVHNRFKNRYMCKYVWKRQKFESAACTGCGRCIDACIGRINKNDLFRELA